MKAKNPGRDVLLCILITFSLAFIGTSKAQNIVSNTSDSGPGSLRNAIYNAPSGATITFASGLAGQTIILTSGQLVVSNSLTLDASALSTPLTISGNNSSRIFYIQANATVVLNSLNLTDGLNADAIPGSTGLGTEVDGGGIYNAGTLTLNHITLSQCTVSGGPGTPPGNYDDTGLGDGGGIYNLGTANLNYCTLTDCSAIGGPAVPSAGQGGLGYGGGIFNLTYATINLNHCTLTGCSAIGAQGLNGLAYDNGFDDGGPGGSGNGGAIFNEGTLISTQSIITASSAVGGDGGNGYDVGGSGGGGSGGGLCNYSTGTATLNQSTVSGNVAAGGSPINIPGAVNGPATGAGIANSGYLTLNECTVSGNVANGGSVEGGGIINQEVATLNQSTVADNVANSQDNDALGGAIYNANNLEVYQSTVVGNAASSNPLGPSGGIFSVGNTYVYLFNTIATDGNTFFRPLQEFVNCLTNGNPLLAPLGNYGDPTQTMPPMPGSPAIDAGSNQATNSPYNFLTDQRGFPRMIGQYVDIGAVEGAITVSSQPSIITSAGFQHSGVFTLNFTNLTGDSYSVLASTNAALPLASWLYLGPATENPPGSGQFQFSDPAAADLVSRFYTVRSP